MFAVAQHGTDVGDLKQLLQVVGDEHHGHVLPLQFADDVHKDLRFADSQRGGRLVHDDQFGLLAECLGDLDELLFRSAQVLDVGSHADMRDLQPIQQFPRSLHHRFFVDEQALLFEMPEEDVLIHRQMLHQGVFLMDHGDAAGGGIRRAGEFHFFAFVEDLRALVR